LSKQLNSLQNIYLGFIIFNKST